MVLTTIYCECDNCEHINLGRCGLDYTTIGSNTKCLGFKKIR